VSELTKRVTERIQTSWYFSKAKGALPAAEADLDALCDEVERLELDIRVRQTMALEGQSTTWYDEEIARLKQEVEHLKEENESMLMAERTMNLSQIDLAADLDSSQKVVRVLAENCEEYDAGSYDWGADQYITWAKSKVRLGEVG
jgi:uncharacterized protein YdcH (DUF465 family)